ncbi:Uncharacterised protein [Serratia liquefaciens]|nr:Uncharacterised protein [Serratia liquefaciens]
MKAPVNLLWRKRSIAKARAGARNLWSATYHSHRTDEKPWLMAVLILG